MSPHLAHVAQGQGIIDTTPCTLTINRMGLREIVNSEIDKMRQARNNHELVDHAAALRETVQIDQEWGNR
jgi:anion-transporting  ArsA/GET3 family ATPase